jgi:uncharacterized membrane protein
VPASSADPGGGRSPESPETRSERRFDLSRATAFSDGVFTIAATLLVLSIDVPQLSTADAGKLAQELGGQMDQYISYAISFAVIGLLWFRHHRFFHELAEVDAPMLALNLGYLAFVALVPFPTELIGEYSEQPIAVALYAATIAAISVFAVAMWWHAGEAHLFRSAAIEAESRRNALRVMVTPVVMLASIPVAYLDTSVARYMWLLLLLARPMGLPRASQAGT